MSTTGHLDDVAAQLLLEGALPPGEAEEAAAHAAACAGCAARVEALRALSAALDGLPLPEAPVDFTMRVLARVDAQERAATERRAALAGALGAVAILLVGVLAGGTGRWIPAVVQASEALGAIAGALHLGAGVLPGALGALRLPLAAICALLALPLLLALRLAAPRRAPLRP